MMGVRACMYVRARAFTGESGCTKMTNIALIED